MSSQNLARAIQIVTRAVEEDEKQNYRDAYYSYCEGLQYFVPMISAESDTNKRKLLQDRATTYLERAEEIKQSFTEAFVEQKNVESANQPAEASTSSTENPVKQALKPAVNYLQICEFVTILTLIHSFNDNKHYD